MGAQMGVGSECVSMQVCEGKRLHEALLERDDAGVTNIQRKFHKECQVIPITNITVDVARVQNLFVLPSVAKIYIQVFS